eukprot:scaffold27520_cov52-Phaeocystis_antarctica.AAC.2
MEQVTNPSRGRAARVCQRRLGCRSGGPHEPWERRGPAQADRGVSERGQPSSGRKRSDRGASAVRVGAPGQSRPTTRRARTCRVPPSRRGGGGEAWVAERRAGPDPDQKYADGRHELN